MGEAEPPRVMLWVGWKVANIPKANVLLKMLLKRISGAISKPFTNMILQPVVLKY